MLSFAFPSIFKNFFFLVNCLTLLSDVYYYSIRTHGEKCCSVLYKWSMSKNIKPQEKIRSLCQINREYLSVVHIMYQPMHQMVVTGGVLIYDGLSRLGSADSMCNVA